MIRALRRREGRHLAGEDRPPGGRRIPVPSGAHVGTGSDRPPFRHHRRGRSGTGRDDERGASLVEFALIAPVLFLLLFAMIDFGITLNDYQSVRQGVREGARNASVLVFPSSCTGTTAERTKCTVENQVGLGADRTYVKVVPPPTWNKESSVLVCAQARATSMTGFTSPFLANRWLKSKIRVRIEKDDPGSAAVEESAPAGTSWSWCS